MNENRDMEDSLNESLEDTFMCKNRCGKVKF